MVIIFARLHADNATFTFSHKLVESCIPSGECCMDEFYENSFLTNNTN